MLLTLRLSECLGKKLNRTERFWKASGDSVRQLKFELQALEECSKTGRKSIAYVRHFNEDGMLSISCLS